MIANSEKPFDDFGSLELYYEIGKTIVFWTNVFFIASTLMTGTFGQSCFAVSKHVEMVVQRICSMFRMKQLDTEHFQEDTMLMRQQRQLETNQIDESAWLERKIFEKKRDQQFVLSDKLADALDFVLGTNSRHRRRYCGDRGEEEDSMRFVKPRDLGSFRKISSSIDEVDELDESSTHEFICQNCLETIEES